MFYGPHPRHSCGSDFLATHIYAAPQRMGDAIDILRAFGASGKPVLIEKTFPLRCSIEEFQTFLRDAKPHSAGVIGFYWGKTPSELKRSGTIADAIMLQKPND